MAKVTKRVLKGIVKECLVEILAEGISSQELGTALTESRENKRLSGESRKTSSSRSNLHPSTDKISFSNAVNSVTSVMTDDPVMSAIFADTAKTTLQEQYGAEASNPRSAMSSMGHQHSDVAARTVASNPIEDLFEGAGNWEALAFAEKKPR
jgi:hypothetical protein